MEGEDSLIKSSTQAYVDTTSKNKDGIDDVDDSTGFKTIQVRFSVSC